MSEVAETNSQPTEPVGPEVTEPTLSELAQGILSRKIKPRVADVRRLAEVVLAREASKKKKMKKKSSGKKAGGGGKKRKLSKIPGQKAKP